MNQRAHLIAPFCRRCLIKNGEGEDQEIAKPSQGGGHAHNRCRGHIDGTIQRPHRRNGMVQRKSSPCIH